jgi:predicted DNA-binding transcriptional regulator YafY
MEVNMALDRIKKIEESIEIQEDPQTFVEQLEAARACGQKLGLLQAQVAIKESYDDAQIEIRSLEERLHRTQCYLEMSQSDCQAHYNHVLQLQEKLNEAARGSPNGELWNLRTKENRHEPRKENRHEPRKENRH